MVFVQLDYSITNNNNLYSRPISLSLYKLCKIYIIAIGSVYKIYCHITQTSKYEIKIKMDVILVKQNSHFFKDFINISINIILYIFDYTISLRLLMKIFLYDKIFIKYYFYYTILRH